MAAVINTSLIFNKITGMLVVKDVSDYAGQGITSPPYTITATIKVTVTTPDGVTVLYDNLGGATPDIVPFTSLFNVVDIDMPLDSAGNILAGVYTVYAAYNVNDSAIDVSVDVSNSFTFDFTPPKICLTRDVNCQASTITSRDETDYGEFLTTKQLLHTLFPPPGAGAVIKTGSLSTLIYNGIYTKTWTQQLVATTTFTFADGSQAVYELTGTIEFAVDCNTDLCKISCCLKRLLNRWERLKGTSPSLAAQLEEEQVNPSLAYAIAFSASINCGNTVNAAEYLALVYKYSGCDPSCNCLSDGPQLVIPIVSGNTGVYVVDSPNSSIAVVPEVISGDTYFHIEVGPALQNIINNLNPVNVVGVAPYIIVTTTVVLGIKTYNVALDPSFFVMENHIEIRGKVSRNPGVGDVYIFTPEYIYTTGAQVNPSASYVFQLGTTVPNIITDAMLLRFSGFKLTSAGNLSYTAGGQIMRKHPTRAIAILQVKDMEFEVCWFDTAADDVTFRFYNPTTGVTKRFNDLIPSDADIYVKIQIYIKPS